MKIRKVVCTEDRKCYFDKPPKHSEMNTQVGGFQDPYDLVPFNRSKSSPKRSKSRHGQGGEGRRRNTPSSTRRQYQPVHHLKNQSSTVKKSAIKPKIEKSKAKKSFKKTDISATSNCCCKVIKGKK